MSERFDWSRLGDINAGRSNLGDQMPVQVYRLLQYTIMDELEERFGRETTEEILRAAGHRAGRAFAQNVLEPTDSLNAFIAELQLKLREMNIGILRIEKADAQALKFVMTVSEDLDCSGLPISGDTVCVNDEGFLAGILNDYTGESFRVVEIDCWATGARTCRFTADRID